LMFAFFVTATVTFRSFQICYPLVLSELHATTIHFYICASTCLVGVTALQNLPESLPVRHPAVASCVWLPTIAFIHVRSTFVGWEAIISPMPLRRLFKDLATACRSNKHTRVHTQWHTRARTHTFMFRTPPHVLCSYLVHTFFNTNCEVLGRSVWAKWSLFFIAQRCLHVLLRNGGS
jgi:hypothetical protein